MFCYTICHAIPASIPRISNNLITITHGRRRNFRMHTRLMRNVMIRPNSYSYPVCLSDHWLY